MATSIPFQEGFLLGRTIDMKTLQRGFLLINEETAVKSRKINETEVKFSFINSPHDVCNIFDVPCEYALKVLCGQIKNEVLFPVLNELNERDSFTVIFRASFFQQKQYLPSDALPKRGNKGQAASGESNPDESKESDESLIQDAVGDLSLGKDSKLDKHGTHWVSSLDVGNELITVVKITCKDEEKQRKLFDRLAMSLGCYCGPLPRDKMESLSEAAKYIDKKLSSKNYKECKLDIHYCSYRTPAQLPKSMSGMVDTLEHFRDQCAGWAQLEWPGQRYEARATSMSFDPAVDSEQTKVKITEDPTSITFKATHHSPGVSDSTNPSSDGEDDSIVVIDALRPEDFFHIRASLEPFQDEEAFVETDGSLLRSIALEQYPQATYSLYNKMFGLLVNGQEATDRLQAFFESPSFMNHEGSQQTEEAKSLLKKVQESQFAIHQLIFSLDFTTMPSEQILDDLLKFNPLNAVNLLIENILTKLPPGDNLDLLVIGKTGHGKSATGNSILGQGKFEESPSAESVTKHTSVGWAEVDKRTIKVVDTPGVCDTSHSKDQNSIDVGIHSISEAIANCPMGFHALLLVIGFGTRMTDEEKKAVGLLKCILGQDVIKTHTICIITFGDRFKSDVRPVGTTFKEWCYSQSGFLKDLFQECNYRCVLFNNRAEDLRERKQQLISLVSHIDKMKAKGTRYTNSLFEFAQAEQRRVIKEKQTPEASEDMMRDIQLVLENLNKMVDNTNQGEEYKKELVMLKDKVDNLSNRLTELESDQMSTLVNTLFSLAQTIHAKMHEIADREKPDNPDSDKEPGQAENPDERQSSIPDKQIKNHAQDLQDYYDKTSKPSREGVMEDVTKNVEQKVKQESNCFPGSAHVRLASGKTVTLEELKVGDQVLAISSRGKLIYDTVYMFGHYEPDAWGCFVVLQTSERSVCVTRDHYVLCVRAGQDMCLPAREVQPGDCLQVCQGAKDKQLTAEPINHVGWETKRGLFAPFTQSGKLLIDGALMSCYVDVLKASTCHSLLWPVRQLYRASPRALAAINGSDSGKPIPVWATTVARLM